VKPPAVRSVDVPTTLSAGEFTPFAGCTDTVRHVKESYGHALMMPQAVILDPAVTVHTPEWLFLSTGIRAVDHAVETICSTAPTPYSDAVTLQALRMLGSGLAAVKRDPSDLDARMNCQLGSWMSIMGAHNGIPMGASHGIGHVLGGTAGVPHGYTSCVMLPHVLRYNRAANAERQRLVAEALGHPGEDAADVMDNFVAELGLPRRLSEVGISPGHFATIATNAMHDKWLHANPVKITSPEQVLKILEAAA